jgi:hypothetical protein
MALDFTTAALDPRVTFTRSGNTATVTNSSGVIAAINADLPRFDFNPTTLVCNGLLIEEARTNLLLNSLINGTSLTTQLVTTTAVAHTLSFYGTGTIVLTGTSSATVVGTGAYPNRQTLTFTPTAGVLTVTVTGTVQFAQLEVGAFATSYIPTAGSQVTRNADVATMTGTNFSDWYNASEGTFVYQGYASPQTPAAYMAVNDGSTANSFFFDNDSGNIRNVVFSGGGVSAVLSTGAIGTANLPVKIVGAYKLDDFAAVKNNGTLAQDLAGAVPVAPTNIIIGSLGTIANAAVNNSVAKLLFYPQRLLNAEMQAFSK